MGSVTFTFNLRIGTYLLDFILNLESPTLVLMLTDVELAFWDPPWQEDILLVPDILLLSS